VSHEQLVLCWLPWCCPPGRQAPASCTSDGAPIASINKMCCFVACCTFPGLRVLLQTAAGD
jgi:hypothetical protein